MGHYFVDIQSQTRREVYKERVIAKEIMRESEGEREYLRKGERDEEIRI